MMKKVKRAFFQTRRTNRIDSIPPKKGFMILRYDVYDDNGTVQVLSSGDFVKFRDGHSSSDDIRKQSRDIIPDIFTISQAKEYVRTLNSVGRHNYEYKIAPYLGDVLPLSTMYGGDTYDNNYRPDSDLINMGFEAVRPKVVQIRKHDVVQLRKKKLVAKPKRKTIKCSCKKK